MFVCTDTDIYDIPRFTYADVNIIARTSSLANFRIYTFYIDL